MSAPTPVHVMVDLETLATGADAAIVQVAAIAFLPYRDGEEVGSPFNCFVGDFAGRRVDHGTLAWWLTQARALHLGTCLPGAPHLVEVLRRLREWFAPYVANTEAHPYTLAGVWSHGLTFDVPILEHAFLTTLSTPPPWGYRTPRDTRTVYALATGGEPPKRRQPEAEHDALDDCRTQISSLVEALRRLRAKGVELGTEIRADV